MFAPETLAERVRADVTTSSSRDTFASRCNADMCPGSNRNSHSHGTMAGERNRYTLPRLSSTL